MKRITVIIILLISIFNLTAQSLPEDLKAAVSISESGSNWILLDTMMNYKEIQQKQLGDIYYRRDDVSDKINEKIRTIRKRKALGWISLITGALAGGAYALFAVLGNDSYDNHLNATITNDVIDYREQFQLYDLLGYISLGVGGTGVITSAISFLSVPSIDDLNNDFNALSEEIQLLEGVLQ